MSVLVRVPPGVRLNRGLARGRPPGYGWVRADDLGEVAAYSLVVFDSKLYAGTATNGRIFRTSDGRSFSQVADVTDQYVWDLAVFGSLIVAACGNPQGSVYRSADGSTWFESFRDPTYGGVHCLAVFGSNIYGGTHLPGGAYILQSADAIVWTDVHNEAGETAFQSLCVFGSYLYAALQSTGEIWRSSDGTTWAACATLPDSAQGNILAVFDGYLYCGTLTNGYIYRSSDGVSWSRVYDGQAHDEVRALHVFNSRLYAGGIGSTAILWTSDGTTWRRDAPLPSGNAIDFADFDGYLYAAVSGGVIHRRM